MKRAQIKGLQINLLSDKAKPLAKLTSKAAGYNLSSTHDDVILAKSRKLIQTDLAMTVPSGTYGQIAPRSGLALKHSIDIGASVIDEDYTGPVGILMINHGTQDFIIRTGDRIAQLILERIADEPIIVTQELSDSSRGNKGFGSTGVKQINIIQTKSENNTNDNKTSQDKYGRDDRDDKQIGDRSSHYQKPDLCSRKDTQARHDLPNSPSSTKPPPTPLELARDQSPLTAPGESVLSSSSTSVQDPEPGPSEKTCKDGWMPASWPLDSPSAPDKTPRRRYIQNLPDTGEDSSNEETNSSLGSELGVRGELLCPIGTKGSGSAQWQSHSPPKEGDWGPGSSLA